MAYDNAQMAQAWGDLLGLTPEQVETLQGDLDQWALGGARLATWSRLATDVNLFNNAAVAMVYDWYAGKADGGPNGDGLYPLMNSDGEIFQVPSPARLQADLSGFEPKGTLPSVDDLPATGEPGDLWVIGGAAWAWNSRDGQWKNVGPFQGPKGDRGDTGPKGDKGDPGEEGPQGPKGDTGERGPKGDKGDQGDVGPKGDTGDQGVQGEPGPKGDTGDTGPKGDQGDQGVQGPKGDKGDRGDAFTVNAQGDLAGRDAYDAAPVGFSYLDVDNGNLYFRVDPTGWSTPIPFGKGEKGDKGDPGEEGPQGPKGDKGEPGADGSDATVTEQAVTDALGFTPADAADTYSKADVDAALEAKADLVDGKVPAGQLVTATTAQVRAGKASGVVIEPDEAAGAMAFTPLTDAATINPDLDTGPNFTLTTTAGVGVGRTIGLPTNGNVGQYYTIRVTADAAGRTLAWNTAFKWPGGTAQAIANTAGAITEVAFKMISAARFDVVGFVKDIR